MTVNAFRPGHNETRDFIATEKHVFYELGAQY